jgi:L-malate glycosyltransferase
MALQARRLEHLLRHDGHTVTFLATNLSFPTWLDPLDRLPGVRTLTRTLVFAAKLWTYAHQVEVIHVFAASWVYFFAAVYPAVLIGRVQKKRVVLNYRGGEAKAFFTRFSWAARPVFKLASTVTAPSAFLQGIMWDFFGIRTSIVPNVIDVSTFRYRERASLAPNFLVTRHLEPMYDVESVLKAFRKIQDSHPSATLTIAGTGSEKERLGQLVADWKLQNVRFLGKVEHADMPVVCDQCDILLNASRVDNFPGSLFEASAAGLAVVSTNPGGIPFAFENEQTALLVPVGDWESLAEAAERVIQSHALAAKLTSHARAMVEQLDWSTVRNAIYQAYGLSARTQYGENDLNESASLSALPKASGGA